MWLFRLRAAWSSPFVRWQGPIADLNSLDLAERVTRRAFNDRGVEWPITELVLGMTIPQRESFYGAPTLAARLVVVTDRTSNGPHLVYPRGSGPGGTVDSENWVLDNFGLDPNTGEGMLPTAERVAAEAGFSKQELDELAAVRYQQYGDSLADDRAFQRKWMVPIEAGSARRPQLIEDDQGIRPTTLAELEALKPVTPDGVVSFGTQTHPADGTAGFVLTSPAVAGERGVSGPLARIISTGFARVGRGTMPKAPVPAAGAALEAAGLGYGDVHVIKTHNPFAVNDLWFGREAGVDPEAINPYGCSLVYGHPQGPTGARAIIELMHTLEERGGGIGLFTGCAAGDTGAAVVLEVSD